MNYTFNRDGKQEAVRPERWGWGVVYKDATELKQFGDDGRFHQFREIDQAQVKMFVMYRLDDINKRIDIPAREGMQLFHFYRHVIVNAGTPAERRVIVYVFGWKDKQTGCAAYHFILPDDRIVASPADVTDLSAFQI